MQRILSALVILIVCTCLGTDVWGGAVTVGSGDQGLSFSPAAYHALIIGIDRYQDWPELRTAVSDARAVAKVLTDAYRFPPENVATLLNRQATERGIVGKLRDLALRLGEEDSLLVFYAGHGHLDDITYQGVWIPVDGSRTDAATWIPNATVKVYLRATKARHVLLVSDSCFSGNFLRGAKPVVLDAVEPYVLQAFRKRSRQALTSGAFEPVVDGGFAGHSVFTSFLLRELYENTSPYLLPSDLHQRIRNGVAANAHQQPLLGDIEGTGGEIGGEFVLFRSADAESAAGENGGEPQHLLPAQADEVGALYAHQPARPEVPGEQQMLIDLDRQIETLSSQLDDDQEISEVLGQLYAFVKQKERHAANLANLLVQADEHRREREAQIAHLQWKKREQTRAAFMVDRTKFLDICWSVQSSTQMIEQAWLAFCSRWHEGKIEDGTDLVWNNTAGKPRPVCRPRPGRVWTVPWLDLDFVWIPAMRCWVGKYEVTNEQFRAFRPQHDSGEFKYPSTVTKYMFRRFSLNGSRQPVVKVYYTDAVRFVEWLTERELAADRVPNGFEYRLPTGREWTRFAHCGETRAFAWGNDWPPTRGNYAPAMQKRGTDEPETLNDDGFAVSCLVDQSGVNDWGLYGVGGNVWEITSEVWRTGPFGHCARGGCWLTGNDRNMRCETRLPVRPTDTSTWRASVGFRLILAPSGIALARR